MRFSSAHVKGVKADVAAGVISITITVPMNDLETAEEVAKYCEKDAGTVMIEIEPRQMSFGTKGKGKEEPA